MEERNEDNNKRGPENDKCGADNDAEVVATVGRAEEETGSEAAGVGQALWHVRGGSLGQLEERHHHTNY